MCEHERCLGIARAGRVLNREEDGSFGDGNRLRPGLQRAWGQAGEELDEAARRRHRRRKQASIAGSLPSARQRDFVPVALQVLVLGRDDWLKPAPSRAEPIGSDREPRKEPSEAMSRRGVEPRERGRLDCDQSVVGVVSRRCESAMLYES